MMLMHFKSSDNSYKNSDLSNFQTDILIESISFPINTSRFFLHIKKVIFLINVINPLTSTFFLATIQKDFNDILMFLGSLITNQRSEFKNSRWRILISKF